MKRTSIVTVKFGDDRYATAELAQLSGIASADYANGIRVRLHHRHTGVLDTVGFPLALTVGVEELCAVRGIGKTKAQKIVRAFEERNSD